MKETLYSMFITMVIVFGLCGFGFGIYNTFYRVPAHNAIINNVCTEYCAPYQVISCYDKNPKVWKANYVDVIIACDNSTNKKVEHLIGYK